MALLTAGQLMETQEKAALLAVTGQAVATLTTVYLALATNATTGSGTSPDPTWLLFSAGIIEPTDTGYARKAITTASGWSTPTSASPSVISNGASITWGPWVANASAALTWGILCSLLTTTSAVPYIAYLLTTPRTPLIGDSVQAAANAFTCTI